MKSIIFACTLALCAGSAHAAPLVFDDIVYSTVTFASVGITTDTHFDDSHSNTLPWLTSSDAVGDLGGAASAFAIADHEFLSAGADAVGGPDGSSGLGSAEFFGSFIANGKPILIDLVAATDGTGNAIRLIVIGNGGTLLDRSWTNGGLHQAYLDIAAGTIGSIDIIVTSGVDVLPGDLATASASASFGVTAVPEPSTLAFTVVAGLCAFGALQGRQLRRRRNPGASRPS